MLSQNLQILLAIILGGFIPSQALPQTDGWAFAYATAMQRAEERLSDMGYSRPGSIAGDLFRDGQSGEMTIHMTGPGRIVAACDQDCSGARVELVSSGSGPTGSEVVWVDAANGITSYPADVRIRVHLYSCSTPRCAVVAMGSGTY